MILKDNFFSILAVASRMDKTVYRIRLNAEHPIYAAHFPGNPITPGVCILQIVVEIAAAKTGRRLFLRTAQNVKFLNVINPLEHPEVDVELALNETADGYKATAVVSAGDVVFSKISMLLTLI